MIYVACPYSHEKDCIRLWRYETMCLLIGRMTEQGWDTLYSPIVHSHAIAEKSSLRGDAAFWWPSNRNALIVAERFLIVPLPGWKQSVGLRQERDYWARKIEDSCLKARPEEMLDTWQEFLQ